MFDGVSTALRSILMQADVPTELAAIEITFVRPQDDPRPSTSALNLFLYELRENTELRSTEPDIICEGGKQVRRLPPNRIDCSFLLTAWDASGSDVPLKEQKLLGQAWQVLARHPEIPSEFFPVDMAAQPYPVPLSLSRGLGERSVPDFWGALGIKLRPSITVTATVSLVSEQAGQSGPDVRKVETQLQQIGGPAQESRFDIGGRVLDTAGTGIEGATIELNQYGIKIKTDAEGRFVLAGLPPGAHMMRITHEGPPKTVTLNVTGDPNEQYDVTFP